MAIFRGEDLEIYISKIKKRLLEHNYKLTPQREATVKVLLENNKKHLSAEDTYFLVKKKVPEIGLATVYRTLELLTDLGLLYKLNFGDGVSRYEFNFDETKHNHHHLVCLNCGKVEEIFEDMLGFIEDKIKRKYSFQIVDHHLVFNGFCSMCKGNEEKLSGEVS